MDQPPSAIERFRRMMDGKTPPEPADTTGPEPPNTPAVNPFGAALWAAVEVIRSRRFWCDLDVWEDGNRGTIEVDPQDGAERIRATFTRREGMGDSAECFLGNELVRGSESAVPWAQDGPYAYLTHWLGRLLPPRP